VRDTVVFDTTAVLLSPLDATTDYYWHVNAQNIGGASAYSTARLFTTGTVLGVDEHGNAPREFALLQNYPNPFNPSTTIQYDIPKAAHVRIVIYDVLGRTVETLVDGVQAASTYRVTWNATNFSSGVYFYRIEANSQDGTGTFTAVKKLVFMK
jgi:hypothetical protein